MTSKKKSVSETFEGLINPAPLSFDPEDDYTETSAKVVEKDDDEDSVYEEYSSSTLRKRKFDLLEDDDERYEGTVTSRKALKMDSFGSEVDGSESDHSRDSDPESLIGSDGNDDSEGAEEDSDNDGSDGEIDNDDDGSDGEIDSDEDQKNRRMQDGDNSKIDGSEPSDDFHHISSRNSELELKNAIAVRDQISLWDNLLECRITSQKVLSAANRLPPHSIFPHFVEEGGSQFKLDIQNTRNSLSSLLEKLITFQKVMLKSYPETKSIDGKTKNETFPDMGEEINSDAEEEEENNDTIENSDNEDSNLKVKKHEVKPKSLKEYSKILGEQHKTYRECWNRIIRKWDDKTRVSAGNLSSRNFSSFQHSAVKQIEQVLSNRVRLIQRTQLKRTSYSILGGKLVPEQKEEQIEESSPSLDASHLKNGQDQNKDYNSEIFDDTDFYHQLLRELIEKKSSDITDPVQLGRQWLQLQKARSKMKRKVDTRASKGRKIRYTVHQKLVNFMPPDNRDFWEESAITELFSSLFGNSSRYNNL